MANPDVDSLRTDVKEAMRLMRKDFTQRTGLATIIPYDGGHRTNAVQARIHADSLKQGFRAAPPGNSAHEYGAAFDLNIVGHTTHDAAKDKANPHYETLARLGEAYGLKAGFRFSGKPDPYHFESNEPLAVQRSKWLAAHPESSVESSGQTDAKMLTAVGILAIGGLVLLALARR